MNDAVSGSISSKKDYKNTPEGQAEYWVAEFEASEKNFRDFLRDGTKIDIKYRGGKHKTTEGRRSASSPFRLNLFHSNTITMLSMLYGNLPKVEVSRRYTDPNDDIGRVAALIMERLLNNDVQDNSETYNSVLKASLQDRLIPGLGVARVRYEFDEESGKEDAPLEYYHWRDVRWGWGRTFADLPWLGFRSFLNKDAVRGRWGDKIADGLQYKNQTTTPDKAEGGSNDADGPWQEAQVWEIWDKKNKKVVWWSPGYDKVLEEKEDFMGIRGFYTCPPPLLANQTTNLYIPTSDYYMAQDLYNEIDTLQTRIAIITQAVKVVGAYNQDSGDLKRIFQEGTDNDLIPVDNWALFAESGGIRGQIDWVPIKEIVEALVRLREIRDETIGLLQQVTGMSDIMRGDLTGQYEGVGQSKMKVQFGSVRIQALQEEFSTFASNLMKIKADIIGRHFSPQTIARLANVSTFMKEDHEYIGPAIAMIKDPDKARLHIIIRPESVAMVDYAQLKSERTEFLTGISNFLSAAAPLMEAEPTTAPFMLQLLQWSLAGYKGASEIEGVVDKAIQVTQEAAKDPRNQKPDPEKIKADNDIALENLKHQNNMAEIAAKGQADMQESQAELIADLVTIKAELKAALAEIDAKLQSDVSKEASTSEINVQQAVESAKAEIVKDVASAELNILVDKEKSKGEQG